MTRWFVGVVGEVLLSIGGIGNIAGLVWLTENRLHGTLLQIVHQHGEGLLYTLPPRLFLIAIAGVALIGRALTPPTKQRRQILHHHAHFHA